MEQLETAAKIEILTEPFRVEVAAVGPSKGPEDAPVTIVEFSDFECPFCNRVNASMEKIRETYGDKVRIVFRQFPLQIHENARKAGEASLCADEQGKFWEMHDGMFAEQKNLGGEGLKSIAAKIEGLDTEALLAWASERLARFKLPSEFIVVDCLPRTASGKVQKHRLPQINSR